MDRFYYWSILELAKRLRSREMSPVEVIDGLLERCHALNDGTRVYITITADTAREQARQAEKEILAGHYRGQLHGVPISLNDNIATNGILTTCASVASEYRVPDHDATGYTRLRRVGAIVIGKANLQEYAISLSPAFPDPINPCHLGRSASGSAF